MNPDNELLKKIHKVSLYILLSFDKVCRENNLTYFLDSGTALGAVRHGGFIPWDDDIDVGMPRKDYERFLLIAQEQLPEDIFLQTNVTDPLYERNAAKLRLKGTVFQEQNNMPYSENGFFIDIFPFDNVPRNTYVAKFHIYFLAFFYRIISSWWGRIEATSQFKRKIRSIVRVIPESLIKRMNKLHIRLCRQYENIDTGRMTCHYWAMTYIGCKAYLFDTDKLLPVRDIQYEGYTLKIVRDADYYLRLMYGDYMKLPPEDKRHGHHLNGTIDFGRYIV